MRALAEFIMRGRAQAAVVALLGSLIPLISPATVALVTLRRGAQDGAFVLAWALLPVIVSLSLAAQDALMAWGTIAATFAVFAASMMLRAGFSWARMIIGLVAIGTALVLLLAALQPSVIEAFIVALNDTLTELQKAAAAQSAGDELGAFDVNVAFVTGLLACAVVLLGIASVALGRWWQALLYNPGGFQAEFHALRLSPLQALVCLGAVLYCSLVATELAAWSLVFTIPLWVAGIALVHGIVAAKKLGVQWLALLYVCLIIVAYVSTLLIALAVIDSWINFRARLQAKAE